MPPPERAHPAVEATTLVLSVLLLAALSTAVGAQELGIVGVAIAVWMVAVGLTGARPGIAGRSTVPLGYGLGLVGAVLMGAGSVALLLGGAPAGAPARAPSVLLVGLGGLLVASAPLRGALAGVEGRRLTEPVTVLTTIASVVVTASLALVVTGVEGAAAWWRPASLVATVTRDGLASLIVPTLAIIVPLLVLTSRWRMPFGATTLLVVGISLLPGAFVSLSPHAVVAAVPAGVAVDVLVRVLRVGPGSRRAVWALGASAPLALWLVAVLLGPTTRITPVHASTAVGWAAIGVGLALLVLPPPPPPIPSDATG